MASFTAKDVQALRQRTGVGMMDCKKALTEANGDTEKAIELLREKGLAAAAKKAGRIAAEGLVVSVIDPDKKVGAVVEVNAETDFVAKNKEFVAFVDAVAKTVLESNPADVEALNTTKLAGSDETVEEALREKILTIGENIKIRRFVRLEGDLVSYVHGEGKIGVMVKFDTDVADKEGFAAYGKDVAMQIAAAAPQYLNKENVPAENLEKEKEILTVQAMNEGKPANIVEKMVEGRLKKFKAEIALVDQPFVKDPDMTVEKYVASKGATVKTFVRFEVGEGIEKREDNFVEEVMSQVKK